MVWSSVREHCAANLVPIPSGTASHPPPHMRLPILRLALPILLTVPLGALATAQIITGQVRSSTGAGVPGVNIDGFDTSGHEIDLANDGTDANGNFTTTVIEGPGVYTFVFYPPAPPLTTHLVGERANVVVVTTTNLGIVTLGAGVLLSGRTLRTGSIPVSNVTLTVIDGPSGTPITQVQTKTNAFGNFNLAVPAHAIELQLNANTSAFVLGSRAFQRSPTGNTAMGDLLLPPGAMVTAHVQRANGTAVGGADFDFRRLGSARDAFVPGDNTNSLGNLSVVVPVGIYDVEICPKISDALPARAVLGIAITTTTNLGTIVVPNGVHLSGTVLDAHGFLAGQVDVNAYLSATGVAVPLCHDNTSASGAYSVYLPAGTYDIRFRPAGSGAPIGCDWHYDVVVNTATTLNGQLPPNGHGNSFGGPVEF